MQKFSGVQESVGRFWRSLFATPFALLLTVSACSSDGSTVPVTPPPVVQLTNSASFAEMISDGQSRIIPSLPDKPKRAELVAAFEALSGALKNGAAGRVKVALDTARSAVDRYAESLEVDSGYEADLDALRLSLDVIAAQLMVDLLTGN